MKQKEIETPGKRNKRRGAGSISSVIKQALFPAGVAQEMRENSDSSPPPPNSYPFLDWLLTCHVEEGAERGESQTGQIIAAARSNTETRPQKIHTKMNGLLTGWDESRSFYQNLQEQGWCKISPNTILSLKIRAAGPLAFSVTNTLITPSKSYVVCDQSLHSSPQKHDTVAANNTMCKTLFAFGPNEPIRSLPHTGEL